MKLRRLYSNLNHYFTPIVFNEGLNIILAEVRLPENKAKSSHNLGKSTLARVIDFCLLGSVGKDHFLRKRAELFDEFVFFIELELNDGTFLTIRRAAANSSKVSFLQSEATQPDATSLAPDKWSHFELAFDRAKALLDGYLDLRDVDPWAFRNVIGYFLRTQADYDNVFKLQRHAGSDKDWKPVLARLLGLDAEIFSNRYDLRSDIDTKAAILAQAERDADSSEADPEKIDALIQLREVEVERMQEELDEFDFEGFDKAKTASIVDQIDVQIADLNQSRYALSHTISELERSLQADEIIFDPKKAKALFEEARVVFPDQLKADFEQLIAFNRAITDERAEYIREELSTSKTQLEATENKLEELNIRRKKALAFLRSDDVFEKYRTLSAEVARTAAEIDILRRQHNAFLNIQDKRRELREAKARYAELQGAAEAALRTASADRTSLLSTVREYFSSIIRDVLGRDAILSVTLNGEGNLDFRTDFVDGNEMSTNEADGTSYKKLLCVAFDLAMVRAHLGGAFPRFIFHDGVFELLDPRPKQNLLNVIRKHADLGIQSIITVMDFDLPGAAEGLDANDIVLRLHDDGPDGRLFHFDSW
ncbi:DUF2326 domain-containing protein [Paracoccus spongiarum]|uniref:DUF2326 domain-containing protein n=1 Tax=Paracoccus spongiarum TaxID=3064387 RepID=A0ABT9JF17_9RHOB|nr:DUF2326 domain-containing protein [Paracoccus sp. 2205BS29-5]MDP5308421.1 DUF2326 domain-containing protein [Paracoccus sp. 2205BS29-5]